MKISNLHRIFICNTNFKIFADNVLNFANKMRVKNLWKMRQFRLWRGISAKILLVYMTFLFVIITSSFVFFLTSCIYITSHVLLLQFHIFWCRFHFSFLFAYVIKLLFSFVCFYSLSPCWHYKFHSFYFIILRIIFVSHVRLAYH